ncbi:hypothetical protein F6S08_07140 [Pseudomonas sp. JV449]|nr:hypothetical protein [Pseudomonas sp. JV449]
MTPEHANEWFDPTITPSRAEEIAKELCQPTEEFEWFPVGKAVGNVRNQGSELIEPAHQLRYHMTKATAEIHTRVSRNERPASCLSIRYPM